MITDKMPVLLKIQDLWNLYSQSPIPSMFLSKEGEIIEYNKAMAELTGYHHENVSDINVWILKILPDEKYRNKFIEISRKSRYKEIDIKRDEFIITRKDGEKRYIEFIINDILHEGKSTDLQFVQCIDITKYKLEHENLLKLAKKFNDIVEGSRDGWLRTDIKGGFIECNSSYRKMLGYPPDEFQKLECRDVTPEKWHNLEEEIVKNQVFKRGYSDVYEKELRRKDGIVFPVEMSVFAINENNKQIGMWGFIRDITERKLIENSLKESENRFRQFFENNPDYCYMVSPEGEIIDINTSSLNALGYKKEEIMGLTFVTTIYAPSSRKKAKNIFKKWGKYDTINNEELKIITKDGMEKTVLISADYIKNMNGEILCSISVQKDITDLKKSEKELKLSKLKLQEQKNALEQMNIALREVIAQIEVEKNAIKDDINTNINEIILPIIKKIKLNRVSNEYIDLLQNHLEKISSSFGRKITKMSYKLTPREMEICTMIESGLTTKEISQLVNISCLTVENHRKNIRKKLGITNNNINLSSFLLQL